MAFRLLDERGAFERLRLRTRLALELPWLLSGSSSYFRAQFLRCHGYEPNLANPRTFSEKLLYRRLFQRSEVFAVCSNKLTVRDFARARLGRDIGIPLIGVHRWLSRGDLAVIAEPFVIKPTHGSGRASILDRPGPDEIGRAVRLYNRMIVTPSWRSWRYNFMPRQRAILVERFLGDAGGRIPPDYKFHCFRGTDGRFDVVFSVNDRSSGEECIAFFDAAGRPLPLRFRGAGRLEWPVTLPDTLPEMIEVARRLSEGFGYVRVDLFSVAGRIYLCEMTFIHRNGVCQVLPSEWDGRLGEMWDLAADPGPATRPDTGDLVASA